MSSDWGNIGKINVNSYSVSGSASETASQTLDELIEEPDYEKLPEEEVTVDDSSEFANLPENSISSDTPEEQKDDAEEPASFMEKIGDFIDMDYTGRKRDATIWSSFYGGSAKHTKDHLGRLVNKLFPKTLTLDPHNREVAYDKDGNKYEKGIWKDPDDPENVKKSKLASVRDTVQGWINKSKLNGLMGTDGKFKTAVDYLVKGEPLLGDVDENGKPKISVDADGKPIIVRDGLDTKIANSKLGNFIDEYNKKHGFDESKFGSANQYRVGQNWTYGSLALYSKSVSTGRVSLLSFDTGMLGNEHAYFQTGIHFLTAKASACAEIGRDHIELSASAEASLVHVETNAGAALRMGDIFPEGSAEWIPEDLVVVGGNFSGTADLCKVYAKGKVGAGYYKGADGKYHLDAGIQGSIGADLCSATGTADVTVMGVNASVTGTVKIGIGAQANLGFEDGKLNVHLGVAFGVGVELGFSVDVSGAVDAGLEVLGDIYEGGKEVLSDIYEGGKEFLSNAWDFVTSW